MKISPIYRLTLVAALLGLLFLASCTSQKQVLSRRLSATERELQFSRDSGRVKAAELARLESELRELQYSILQFDEKPCPEIRIPEGAALLNADSVARLITDLNAALSGANNRLKVYADGSWEAEGRIGRFQQDVARLQKTIQQLSRERDSAYKASSSRKKEVVVEYRDREKVVKRRFMPWWFWLLLLASLILGGVGGWKGRGFGQFWKGLDPNQVGKR